MDNYDAFTCIFKTNGCADNWSKQSVKPGSVVGKQSGHNIHMRDLTKEFHFQGGIAG